MKRIAVLVLCLLVSRTASSAPKERPLLLWRVEKAGAVSHLLGTCHLPIPVEHALPAAHEAALSGARVVYDELDIAAVDPMSALRVTVGEGHLSEQLGPDAWGTLSRRLRDTLPAAALDRMHPWAVWAMVALAPAAADAKATSGNAPEVLDTAIAERARASGVEIRHLESLEQQATMMSQFDPDFLVMLESGGEADAASKAESEAILTACSTGDTSGLDAWLTNPDYARFVGPLLDARNASWAVTLEPELAQGGVFVAVGAGHMLGPKGLLTLLEEQGYTVERLTGPRSRYKGPPGGLGTLESFEVPPPPDPALVAAWKQNAQPAADAFCADGGLHRVCFEPDPQLCREDAIRDIGLCYEQWGDALPPYGTELVDPLYTQMLGCTMTGMIIDAVAKESRSTDPMCLPIWAAMDAQGK